MSGIFKVNGAYIIYFNKTRSQREIKYKEVLFWKMSKLSSVEQELKIAEKGRNIC